MSTSERRLKARVLIMRNEVAYSIVRMRHAADAAWKRTRRTQQVPTHQRNRRVRAIP